jgi:hypothetical protein
VELECNYIDRKATLVAFGELRAVRACAGKGPGAIAIPRNESEIRSVSSRCAARQRSATQHKTSERRGSFNWLPQAGSHWPLATAPAALHGSADRRHRQQLAGGGCPCYGDVLRSFVLNEGTCERATMPRALSLVRFGAGAGAGLSTDCLPDQARHRRRGVERRGERERGERRSGEGRSGRRPRPTRPTRTRDRTSPIISHHAFASRFWKASSCSCSSPLI